MIRMQQHTESPDLAIFCDPGDTLSFRIHVDLGRKSDFPTITLGSVQLFVSHAQAHRLLMEMASLYCYDLVVNGAARVEEAFAETESHVVPVSEVP